jgi:hypothetical protein
MIVIICFWSSMSYKRREREEPGYESEYEDDEGNKYKSCRYAGSGSSAKGREFKSSNPERKNVIVLAPREGLSDEAIKEVLNKRDFFQEVHSDKGNTHYFPPDYFLSKDTYRLVVPQMPGMQYSKFNVYCSLKKSGQLKLILLAIQAIEFSHKKGRISLDCNLGNIIYDFTTGTSNVIDGGFSAKVGDEIDKSVNEDKVQSLAPECKRKSNVTVTAQPPMDVYSFGYCFKEQFQKGLDSEIRTILNKCTLYAPEKRPTLSQLTDEFQSMLGPMELKLTMDDIFPYGCYGELKRNIEDAAKSSQTQEQILPKDETTINSKDLNNANDYKALPSPPLSAQQINPTIINSQEKIDETASPKARSNRMLGARKISFFTEYGADIAASATTGACVGLVGVAILKNLLICSLCLTPATIFIIPLVLCTLTAALTATVASAHDNWNKKAVI